MSDGFVLLQDGFVGLDLVRLVVDGEAVPWRILFQGRPPASLVQEIFRQVEIGRFPGQAIELDQGKLDLLVPGEALPFPRLRPEGPGDEVGIHDSDVEKRPLPRGLIMGDGRFVEMAGVVELVAHGQLGPPLGARPGWIFPGLAVRGV